MSLLLGCTRESAQPRAASALSAPAIAALSTQRLPACFGEMAPLTISSQMPYTLAQVDDSSGQFLIDLATTASSVDVNGVSPALAHFENERHFERFAFFGSWSGGVTLNARSYTNVSGSVRQGGIIGTDLLSVNVYTLDYKNRAVYRAVRTGFCDAETLRGEGLRAASVKGSYSNHPAPGALNVPSVCIQVGGVKVRAQLDTGFDDNQHKHSVNINDALFERLSAVHGPLRAEPEADVWLSTCVAGQQEQVRAYRLNTGESLQVLGVSGAPIRRFEDPMLFRKSPMPSCGGIGNMTQKPAAQMAASFFVELGVMVFDPFASLVWMPGEAGAAVPHGETPADADDPCDA